MINIINNTLVKMIVRSILILTITYIVNIIIERAFNKDKVKDIIHLKFFKNILKAIVWIVGLSSIASQFSTFSKLANTILAGSGILTVVIGLAAQESFANVISGLFISVFKPFNIGDRIQLVGDDTTGYVEDITLRHTVIRTIMNYREIIPNSIMNSSKIINTTYSKGASYQIRITIAYEDKDKRYKAKEILEEIVTNHPLFYDIRSEEDKENGRLPVEALCTAFESSGIQFTILMWTESIMDNQKACSDCRLAILDRFEKEGIEIPYDKIRIIN